MYSLPATGRAVMTSTASAFSIAASADRNAETATGFEPSWPPTDRGEDVCALQNANLAGHVQQTFFHTSSQTPDSAALVGRPLRRLTPMSGGRCRWQVR